MADSSGNVNARKVAILTIDRIHKQDAFSSQTRRTSTAPINLQHSKRSRLRPPLQDSADCTQYPGGLYFNPQNELKFLVTCLFKQSQEEHDVTQENNTHTGVMKTEQYEDYYTEAQQLPRRRLLKARLKPLHPVHINGPTVTVCQGMLPERLQCNPALDGLTRLQHKLFGNVPLQHEKPCDSAHYTSIDSLTRTK